MVIVVAVSTCPLNCKHVYPRTAVTQCHSSFNTAVHGTRNSDAGELALTIQHAALGMPTSVLLQSFILRFSTNVTLPKPAAQGT